MDVATWTCWPEGRTRVTPKEVVLRTIERSGPPRLPILYLNRDQERSDVLHTGLRPSAAFLPSRPGLTEWGYTWHSFDQTMGQPVDHPLGNWDQRAAYVPPDTVSEDDVPESGYKAFEDRRDRTIERGKVDMKWLDDLLGWLYA